MTNDPAPLDPATVPDDPLDLFAAWFQRASDAGVPLPHWMALATASPSGAPSVRAVLLKQHDPRGLVFYSNRHSRKGLELAANPVAAACFVWTPLDRQVRVEGAVVEVSAREADAYFDTRPARARAGAAASPQSQVIDSREALLADVERVEREHPDGVPRPAHWGGYRLLPDTWEFWEGRDDRLHDRVRYRRSDGSWVRDRLAP